MYTGHYHETPQRRSGYFLKIKISHQGGKEEVFDTFGMSVECKTTYKTTLAEKKPSFVLFS